PAGCTPDIAKCLLLLLGQHSPEQFQDSGPDLFPGRCSTVAGTGYRVEQQTFAPGNERSAVPFGVRRAESRHETACWVAEGRAGRVVDRPQLRPPGSLHGQLETGQDLFPTQGQRVVQLVCHELRGQLRGEVAYPEETVGPRRGLEYFRLQTAQPRERRLQQGAAGPRAIRGRAGGQARGLVDGAMSEPSHPPLGKQDDGSVSDEVRAGAHGREPTI